MSGEATTNTFAGGWGSKGKAVVVCVLIFAIYYALIRYLHINTSPWFDAIPQPAGAPPTWWAVDKMTLRSAFVSLAAAIVPVWIYLALTGRTLSSLGFDRTGTALGWVLVLVAQTALIYADTHMGALGHAPGALGPYALFASVVIGFGASFAEETLFRGFMTEELRRGGFGMVGQIIVSMLLFGAAHLSYMSGPYGWTVPVFTGLLGGFWSFVYIISGRSLWPTITAHFINDMILIPSVFYLMLGGPRI